MNYPFTVFTDRVIDSWLLLDASVFLRNNYSKINIPIQDSFGKNTFESKTQNHC